MGIRWIGVGFLFSAVASVFAQSESQKAAVEKYIRQYGRLAVKEMTEFRIPASITLAQGIIESEAGRSDLAVKANNHFGIKCHKGWSGSSFIKDDETRNECFRKYDDPAESYRDHSLFLTGRDRYKGLFLLDILDYRGWANGLKAAGYATNPAYAEMLIRTIETYDLLRFDRPGSLSTLPGESTVNPAIPTGTFRAEWKKVARAGGDRDIYENNSRRMVIARPADDLYALSRDVDVPVRRLLKYNELSGPADLRPGQEVYLGPKRRKAEVKFHTVSAGETLYAISQRYGIQLKMIWRRNGLTPGQEPGPGWVLRLR